MPLQIGGLFESGIAFVALQLVFVDRYTLLCRIAPYGWKIDLQLLI